MSEKLINEYPMLVLPSLAVAMGLNDAIVLQQIHFLCDMNRRQHRDSHFKDGRWWCFNTVEQWSQVFPWWSEKTIKRVLYRLRDAGILLAEKHHESAWNHTLWYSINYSEINRFLEEKRSGQNEPLPSGQNEPSRTETTTEKLTNNNAPVPTRDSGGGPWEPDLHSQVETLHPVSNKNGDRIGSGDRTGSCKPHPLPPPRETVAQYEEGDSLAQRVLVRYQGVGLDFGMMVQSMIPRVVDALGSEEEAWEYLDRRAPEVAAADASVRTVYQWLIDDAKSWKARTGSQKARPSRYKDFQGQYGRESVFTDEQAEQVRIKTQEAREADKARWNSETPAGDHAENVATARQLFREMTQPARIGPGEKWESWDNSDG